jgi:hypothetical protein
MTATARWIERQRKENPPMAVALDELEVALHRAQVECGSSVESTDGGTVVGNVFRGED